MDGFECTSAESGTADVDDGGKKIMISDFKIKKDPNSKNLGPICVVLVIIHVANNNVAKN